MSEKVTFKEVAELAGVSTQTVSRVTNGGKGVNPETLLRVQEAIDKLGYVPNKGAQLLVQKKAKIFGVLTLEMTMEGASSIVAGIRVESEKAGYSMSLSVSGLGEENLEKAIREFKSQQVDAILINLPVTKEEAENIVKKHIQIPFLFIDTPQNAAVNQVSADHYEGGKQVAQLMLSQGRTKFAFLNGPSNSHAAILRRQAWEDEIKKSNAEIIIEAEGDWSAKSGYMQTTKLLFGSKSFDALLVCNDQMALGALRACSELKIAVPQQIAVTGFDDTLNSEYFSPPLTTIRQDFLEIGKQAVQQILYQLNDGKDTSKQLIPVELIERQSTMAVQKNTDSVKKIEDLLQEIHKLLPKI